MNQHSKFFAFVLIGLVSISALVSMPLYRSHETVAVSQEPGQSPSAGFMRLKLEPAKKVLEGIALADFQMIRSNSEQMRKLALDASWMVVQTEAYSNHSQDYQKSLSLINRMCDEEDLDGVTLAYMQMTMRCVQCHKTLRDTK
jgi:hypothetical protein